MKITKNFRIVETWYDRYDGEVIEPDSHSIEGDSIHETLVAFTHSYTSGLLAFEPSGAELLEQIKAVLLTNTADTTNAALQLLNERVELGVFDFQNDELVKPVQPNNPRFLKRLVHRLTTAI